MFGDTVEAIEHTTIGLLIKVKLNVTLEPVPETNSVPLSNCLAVDPPVAIAVAFTLPLTSNDR